MIILQLNQVAVGYGKTPVAENLNIKFQANEIVCLLGANGCGKTTLLKTILGVLMPLKGKILINQIPQIQWTKQALAQFIGYVPQAHHSTFGFSVEEMVLMGRNAYVDWYSSPTEKDKAIVLQCLQQLNIEHLYHRTYSQLSGGERQLVLIARALAQQPKLLIMDEPTSNLDFGNQIRVLEQIKQLKQQGLSILLTTHQPNHALCIADRAVLLHQGKIMSDGICTEVLNLENLSQIYQLDKNILANWRVTE
ncbi:iron complex transport system ATP-binding protein [Cricetibacter osteomyelitidis]|uniref:Iron complex transport system ATP-binding protein n=1 Tax=Cricetibacter osteomyelitidis TaxID=1521931 RepID=A0A4R2TKI3_9PAST|nr:ABC transporter ATP-binding protein [Cricetibacter osteomyelitidis]TCP95372.1 iron complex transport system ATP-binding protein [Cricetibacter osteomyelitidis]